VTTARAAIGATIAAQPGVGGRPASRHVVPNLAIERRVNRLTARDDRQPVIAHIKRGLDDRQLGDEARAEERRPARRSESSSTARSPDASWSRRARPDRSGAAGRNRPLTRTGSRYDDVQHMKIDAIANGVDSASPTVVKPMCPTRLVETPPEVPLPDGGDHADHRDRRQHGTTMHPAAVSQKQQREDADPA
jgi:hypothetical protein